MADLVAILQLLGAGSVGAIVAQYVGAGPERRQARAAARNAMTTLEEAVWAHGKREEWGRLRVAVHTFEAAAMIAGVPRDVSHWYVTTRVAFYLESRRDWETNPDPEHGGGLSTRHVKGLNQASEVIYAVLWYPQRSRFLWRRRLDKAKKQCRVAVADSPALLRDLDDRERRI